MDLEQALGPTASPNTLAALRAGFLASEGLMHDARLSLIEALKKDPNEPTLYLLLAHLYAKVGLPELAAASYDEAQFLSTSSAKRRTPSNR
jgi:Tfp pilus assembly protein PilF